MNDRTLERTSNFHQPERGVDIRILRAEPIAERRPRETSGGARRGALEHIVRIIEERLRVVPVKGERLEAGERGKRSGSPFPAVAGELGNAGGLAGIPTGDRYGVPVAEVEIIGSRVRRRPE